MSKRLEELFNMSPSDAESAPETQEEAMKEAEEQQAMLRTADDAIDKIDTALPTVKDLEASDKEMDELALLAKDTFEDLINLSMNVEPRYSGPIIQSASTLLGHAITAKVAKMDKKLKMVDLQLKKANLDLKMKTATMAPKSDDEPTEGEGMVVDRTELLRQILAGSKK